MPRLAFILASSLALSASACATTTPTDAETHADTAEDGEASESSPSDFRLDGATLRFSSPDEASRFARAHACFGARAQGWEHEALSRHGNFIEEHWWTGPEASHPHQGTRFREARDSRWAGVGTLHYEDEWPAVFGVQVYAGRNSSAGSGWDLSLMASSNGKSVLGEGLHLDYRLADTGERLSIGSRTTWKIGESEFEVQAEGDAWQILERLRASPEALRDEGVASWRALERQVLAAFDADQVLECVYGPYQGGGIPPACESLVPVDSAAKVEFEAQIAARIQRLEADHVAMHQLLVELAPPDCF